MRSATYLYHPDHEPRVFDLAPGEALPDGWHDAPVPRAVAVDGADDLAAATAEVARLQDVISKGMAENDRLADELQAKEDELDAAAKSIAAAAEVQIEVKTENDALKAEKARLEKVIEDLEADIKALKPKKPAAK